MVAINWNPNHKVLRQFGITLALFTGLLTTPFSVGAQDISSATGIALLFMIVFAGFTLIWPPIAKWPFVGLSLVTFPIGFVLSWILLTLLFFLVITPIGIALRLSGRDALRLRKQELDGKTFWIDRPAKRSPEYYLSQWGYRWKQRKRVHLKSWRPKGKAPVRFGTLFITSPNTRSGGFFQSSLYCFCSEC